jgi:D-apiose dehydrogenase
MTLRVAIAGTGYFSRFHFEAWRRIPGARLVAAASLDPAGLVEAAARHVVPRQYASVPEMLERERPDVLDIVTPPHAHRALVEAAAGHGVHVICQKPFGGDLATARALVETAAAAGITLVVHENFRFQPWYREIRRLLDAGALGELYNAAFRLRPGDGQGPDAYLARQPYFQAMERFLIHETAIHLIDVFRYLMGEIGAVFARLRRLNPVIAGEDAGLVLFDFTSGAAGLFDGNRLVDFPADNPRLIMGEMRIEGSAASVRLDGWGRLFVKPHGAPERQHPYPWRDEGFAGDSVHALQQHVLCHFEHGTPLENTGRAYLRNLEIEEAIYRSAASGRLDPIDVA